MNQLQDEHLQQKNSDQPVEAPEDDTNPRMNMDRSSNQLLMKPKTQDIPAEDEPEADM